MIRPKNPSHSFDVIVLGRGITALSTAWNLKLLGVSRVGLVGPERRPTNCLSEGTSATLESTLDNVTRLSHQYGTSTAEQLVRLGRYGFQALQQLAMNQGIPWNIGSVVRLATSIHESNEMTQAVGILNGLGLKATLDYKIPSLYANISAVQHDGLLSATCEVSKLLLNLEQASDATITSDLATSISWTNEGAAITCESGLRLSSQMVVTAAHLNTGRLVPNLNESLVSYADQEISFFCEETRGSFPIGSFHILHHGHYTMWKDLSGRFHMTGARFLRPLAGMEAKTSSVLPKVTEHLLKQCELWFGFKNFTDLTARGLLDCRPCDELPIAGPMFGEERQLVGVGYSGSGVAVGFAVGRALAELIATGKTKLLDPSLYPQRLRTL